MQTKQASPPNSAGDAPPALSHDEVVVAHQVIKDTVPPTPLKYSEYFSKKFNAPVYLKLENLNISGSFKIRGAAHALLTSPLEELQRAGVMSTSAGNHAQGLAYMTGKLGIKTTVFMPQGTSMIKVAATQAYGAEVRLEGDHYIDAERRGLAWAKTSGAKLIHAFAQRDVVLGQGTVGLEIQQQQPEVGVVIAPVGGGGLLSGIAAYMRGLKRQVGLVGVQSHLCCPVAQQFRPACSLKNCGRSQQQAIKAQATLADGIAIKKPHQDNLSYLRRVVDSMVCVSEDHIAGTIMTLLEREHILAEGAGAATVAALEADTAKILELAAGRPIVCVISGGNIDASLLARIMQKGLMHSHRLIRICLQLEDHPGALAECLLEVARSGANLYHLDHNRIFNRRGVKAAEVIFDLEIASRDHCKRVLARLRAQGYQVELIHESDQYADGHA